MKRTLNPLKTTIIILLLIQSFEIIAQVGINPTNSQPDASAMLHVQSTDKGLLMPRMTTDERNTISNPAEGLMIYNIDDSCFNYFTGVSWIKNCGIEGAFLSFPGLSVGGNNNDYGRGISVDASGNSYITGAFNGTASFGDTTLTSNGNEDIFVVKMDPAGQVVWAIQAGGLQGEYGSDITVDASGNSYITGYFSAIATFGDTSITSFGAANVFIAKISSAGEFLWVSQAGGGTTSFGHGIAIDALGNSYITGFFGVNATFGDTTITSSGAQDIFIAKADPAGQFLWAVQGGGSNFDEGVSVSTDGFGNSFITGRVSGSVTIGDTTLTGNGNTEDLFVAKINTSGQLKWALLAGGGGYKNGEGIASDGFGNSYITGYFGGTTTFGDTTLTSFGISDIFVTKIDSLGNTLWAVQAGGTSSDHGSDIFTDLAGNSLVTGYFRSTALFGASSLTSSGNNDVFVMKIDSAGEILWASQGGGSNEDNGISVSMDSEGNGYITGNFKGSTATFGDQTFLNNGGWDIFVWIVNGTNGSVVMSENKLSELQDGDRDPENELQTLSLSGSDLSIDNGNTIDLSSISIEDNMGNHSATQNLELNSFYLSGDGDDEGIYVDANGRIGIGKDDPGQALDVAGNLRVDKDDAKMLFFSLASDGTTSTSNKSEIRTNVDPPLGLTANPRGPGDHTMSFHVASNNSGGNVKVMVLQGDGNVGIGTSDSVGALLDLGDNSGTIDTLLRFNTERPWQFEEEGSGSSTKLLLRSTINGKIFRIAASDGLPVADFRAAEQADNRVSINKEIGNNTLEVNGTASKSTAGDWLANSDARLKKNIQGIPSETALKNLLSLHGITYEWNDTQTGYKRPKGIQYGFTAQNVQAVFPELVTKDELGFLQTSYGTYDAMYVEAIRALLEKIEQQKVENKSQQNRIEALEDRLENLETLLFPKH